jgi:2-phosphosulfolactate phosphatase
LRLDVAFTPGEISPARLASRTVVVIDVLRATSTILEALVNGAREIVPVESVGAAVRNREELGRDEVLLCGERRSRSIPGFDLGNSPLEFTPRRVTGMTLLMTTTNGTRALLAGSVAEQCIVASFLNAGAAAGSLLATGSDAVLLCAGAGGRFALEDAVCAGLIAQDVLARTSGARIDDAAKSAMLLARRFADRLPRLLGRTAAGRRLTRAGFAEDITFCAALNRYTEVPRLHERRVTIP